MKLNKVLIVNLVMLCLAFSSLATAITIYFDTTQVFTWTIDPSAEGELKISTVNFDDLNMKFYDNVTYTLCPSNCSALDNVLVVNVYAPPKTLTLKIEKTPTNHKVFRVDLLTDQNPKWPLGTKVLTVDLSNPTGQVYLDRMGTYIFDLQVTFRSEGIESNMTVEAEVRYQVSG